ncbi:MAG: hypothetical protein LBP21_02790 [Synergistaceae bacterium]|nr:hypothetical protein [Synergistaceae bacterium]
MRRKSGILWVLLAGTFVFMLLCGGCGGSSNDGGSDFAGGSGTREDPWQIATAQQLENVGHHLAGHFLLTRDIDLASYENWTPLGAFVPASGEDEEAPIMELTFTGVFDGGGHTISNVTVSAPEGSGVGLFGCTAGDNGSVSNLTVKNVKVKGAMLVGGVVGYGRGSGVKNVRLAGDNTVEGGFLVGGIVGGGFCDIEGCTAQADVTLSGNDSQGIGVLAGGMEACDIVDSSAAGTVTVNGTGNMSIGGLAGSAHNSKNVRNCTSDVTMTIGGNNILIGGLVGHSGMESSEGDEPTSISGCSATAVINASAGSERIGGIVGGGFFTQQYREFRPEPGAIRVEKCVTHGKIDGGTLAGTLIGYAYSNSVAEGCTSDMTINGQPGDPIGATSATVSLDDLK